MKLRSCHRRTYATLAFVNAAPSRPSLVQRGVACDKSVSEDRYITSGQEGQGLLDYPAWMARIETIWYLAHTYKCIRIALYSRAESSSVSQIPIAS